MLMNVLRDLFAGWKSKRLLADARRLFDAGELDGAERAGARLAEISPRLADTHHLRGLIALRRGQVDPAIRHLEAAVEARGSEPSFHLTLADVFQTLGRHERTAFHLARALKHLPRADPRRRELMLRLAVELEAGDQLAEAEDWYRNVLEIDPYDRDALLRLATRRFEESDAEQARLLMSRIASPRDAASRLRRALMSPIILQSNEEIEAVRRRYEQEMNELLEARLDPIRNPDQEVGMTAFNLAYHGRNNAELLRLQGRVSRSIYPARSECPRKLLRGRRLRIGFVSTFFHHHSVGRTTIGLIRDLPRADFEVYVFAVAPRANDDWAEAIRAAADRYVSLPAALEQVRETIDAAELDILLFADIGMHPLTYFLALWRLAPIQLVTWGHSVTSGIDTIDYYASSDAIEAPGSEDQYTEKLIRLPGYFMPRYRRPALEGPRKTRQQLGLPEDAHVYYCPQNLFKLHPDFDATLKAILDLDPRAGILLMESRKSWAGLIRRRFARTLGAAASRVHFVGRMPQPDFLHYIAAADVILDPFYFGGCNSSCEALALGVPIVTLPAFQLPGRFTLGLYREIGVEDCIAGSPEHYAEIAVRLARQPDYRRSVSERISARSGELFDRPDTGVALGEALLRIAETAR